MPPEGCSMQNINKIEVQELIDKKFLDLEFELKSNINPDLLTGEIIGYLDSIFKFIAYYNFRVQSIPSQILKNSTNNSAYLAFLFETLSKISH